MSGVESVRDGGGDGHDGHVGARGYVFTWIALLGLTGLTFGLSYVHLAWAQWPVTLGIATTKATLVALFFMHLAEARAASRLALVIAVLIVVLLASFTALDAVTR